MRSDNRAAQPPTRTISASVGLLYLIGSAIVFRDVLFAIPSVLAGDTVIVGDELVPFFDGETQYQSQARGEFNDLTHGYEFRVRYSYLTSWVRHYAVLPFALLIVPPFAAWIAYASISWFISRAFGFDARAVYTLVAGPIALIYVIVIYAKVTHFYTLVLGLALMTLAICLMMSGLLVERERPWRHMWMAALVTLLNPAVHYLVLFTLFFAIAVTVLVGSEALALLRRIWKGAARRRDRSLPRRSFRTLLMGSLTGRCVAASATVLIITLIPYAMFVRFVALRGVEQLSQTVPSDYYFIRDASVSMRHLFSFDLAGIMDKIQFGDYLARDPRSINQVYSLLLFAPLLSSRLRRTTFTTRSRRLIARVIYVNILFAMWATIGYADPEWFPTFHRVLAETTTTVYRSDAPFGEAVLSLASTIVQVLRFPHRFQLMVFALGAIPMSLALLPAIEPTMRYIRSRRPIQRHRNSLPALLARTRTAAIAVLCVGLLAPLFANAPYRDVYVSGSFGDLAAPLPVVDLEEVRLVLDELPAGKTIVLPPAETSKVAVDEYGSRHKLIDKFFIYYLNKPSYYYGLTGDLSNKLEFFLMLRALYYEEDWWINIARDLDVHYIVVNKRLETNGGIGAEYLPGIESTLRGQIERLSSVLTLHHENDTYVLYELTDGPNETREDLLVNTGWNEFLDVTFGNLELTRCWNLHYPTGTEIDWEGDETIHLLTDDREAAALDLYAKRNPDRLTTPSSRMFPFNENIVSSNYYLSPMFRLYLFFSSTRWNRTGMIIPGVFGTLDGTFIGLPRSTDFTINVRAEEPGPHRLLLRASATRNDLTMSSAALPDGETSLQIAGSESATLHFESSVIYERERVPLDAARWSDATYAERLNDDVIPVSVRFEYHDLGVIDLADTAPVRLDFAKSDDNPLLIEGLVAIPIDHHETLELPQNIVVIDPDASTADNPLSCGGAPIEITCQGEGCEAGHGRARAPLSGENPT